MLDVLRLLIRRWWVLLGLAAAGALIAAASVPATAAGDRGEPRAATAELVLTDPGALRADPAETQRRLQLAARLAELPEVAQAAAVLRPAGAPTAAVRAVVHPEVDSVLLTARAATSGDAVAAARAYADATVGYVGATTGTQLRSVGEPVETTAAASVLPADRLDRAVWGGGVGLLTALVLALSVRRNSGPLRSRRDVERGYRTAVLAEVPRTRSRSRYPGYVACASRPTGTVAETYRTLRCAVINRGRPGTGGAPRVIAVASPSRGDGRSSVAINLAAALAEAGRRVLVVDCDFGHPTAHFSVGIHPGTGLSDLLSTADPGARLAEVVRHHPELPGVAVLSIGTRGGRRPGALATALPQVLAVARRMVDVVVLDSEPLTCAGDSVDALELADAVVIVAKPGRTTETTARLTADLLDRCGSKVVGAVLLGTQRERECRTPYLLPAPVEPAGAELTERQASGRVSTVS